MENPKSGDIVKIGDMLGYEEQYLGSQGSTYSEDGKIYAAINGILEINEKDRIIHIDAKNEEKRIIPKAGDYIIGEITQIRKNSVGVRMISLNDKVILDSGNFGNIHVSNVSKSYVDKLDNVFQKTDLIRAKVLTKYGNEWKIATDASNLGVIRSYCKYCGKVMVQKGRDQVKCPFCNHSERKILASDYGKVEIRLRF
ncbi:MAG: exosome complex RNA-binding protein Csl4 [Promethearchaeota archaeon]